MQKLTRRLREEPLIPLGCLLTCWALLGASRAMKAGDHNTTNRMFRRRIYAQGFTIAAMAAGMGGDGYTVQTRAELGAALRQALATRGCFQLIDVRLAPGARSPTLQRFVQAVRRLSMPEAVVAS